MTSTQVVMPQRPAVPTAPAAVALSPTSIQVTWTDASSGETGFAVSRRIWNSATGWQPWAEVGRAAADSTAFIDDGPPPGPTYEYRVAACAGVVCSAWTPTVRIRLP
jgi:hypothetical protein